VGIPPSSHLSDSLGEPAETGPVNREKGAEKPASETGKGSRKPASETGKSPGLPASGTGKSPGLPASETGQSANHTGVAKRR